MILDEIVASTRKLLPERQSSRPLTQIKEMALTVSPPKDFAEALCGQTIKLIAEVKRASPSKGPLSLNLDAAHLATTYESSGAAAISVLTETEYFKGSLDDLQNVRAAVNVPILRKDFIIDPYQVYEARACGADAILLIAAVLNLQEMRELLKTTQSLGMAALVEVHNRDELEQVLQIKPKIVGINNRNLADFSVSLDTTAQLRPLIPSDIMLVSESGIHTKEDVLRLREIGVDAILVGEALVKSADPAEKIRALLD